ncbi:MAG: hypothetical protein HY939_05685 [Gammaproteobacteria bacterium]|nr:hypothetical protein [Gammaproteobacteria bacterium]
MILLDLSPEQRTVVYEACKEHLPSLIKTAEDFAHIIHHLSLEQGRAVCEASKGHLPSIIKIVRHFSTILQYLSPEQRRVVCEACKEHLPSIIKTAEDFANILQWLSPEQCRVIYEACKNRLPQLIQTETGIEIFNTRCPSDNVRLLKHYYLLASLDAYMTRVEGHGDNDFSYGFWRHKTSRSLSRKVNYELAKKIRETIIERDPYTGDIDTLLSPKNLKDMRDEIVTNLKTSDLFFNKNYVDRGMNSDTLKKAFHFVRTPESRQPSPGNGRR